MQYMYFSRLEYGLLGPLAPYHRIATMCSVPPSRRVSPRLQDHPLD
eukprot:SAG11_NODE_41435_length_194_cov_12.294737_1_plen_45_part_01